MSNCDKCTSTIKDGECDCGYWYDNGDHRINEYQIYFDVLHAYKKHLKENKVKAIFGSNLADEYIQMLIFEGTSEEFEYLKDALETKRRLNKPDTICKCTKSESGLDDLNFYIKWSDEGIEQGWFCVKCEKPQSD